MRMTSVTHPLKIAAIPAGHNLGRVGITFCPGKHDAQAVSGYWARDLSLDLETIRGWGAAAVVTLVESKELDLLRVPQLGDEVVRRGMLWFHLPIVDVWQVAGHELRALIRNGRDVLVHCRGGLGRAGTIASKLLIEFGMEPAMAIRKVRTARPGAIETNEQEQYVLGLGLNK